MTSKAAADARYEYERESAAAYRDFYLKLKAVGKLTVAKAIGPVPFLDVRPGGPKSDSPPFPQSAFERVLFRLYEHLIFADKRMLLKMGLPVSTIIRRLKQNAESTFKEVYLTNLEEFAQRAGFYAEKAFPEPYLPLVPLNARGHTSRLLRRIEDEILEQSANRLSLPPDKMGSAGVQGSAERFPKTVGRPRGLLAIDGEKLKDFRDSNSQRAFARRAKISKDTLQRAENKHSATKETISKICKYARRSGVRLTPQDLIKNQPH